MHCVVLLFARGSLLFQPCNADEVEWSLKWELSNTGSSEKACSREFPDYNGRRRLWYWRKRRKLYESQRWDLMDHTMAAKVTHIGNTWKTFLEAKGHAEKLKFKGPKHDRFSLPPEIVSILDQQVEKMAVGENTAMQRSEPITKHDIQTTLKQLCESWNEKVEEQSHKVTASNLPWLCHHVVTPCYSLLLLHHLLPV